MFYNIYEEMLVFQLCNGWTFIPKTKAIQFDMKPAIYTELNIFEDKSSNEIYPP